MFDDTADPEIRGEFASGATGDDMTEVTLTLTIDDGNAVTTIEQDKLNVSGNKFTYSPTLEIMDREYTAVATATDENGKTAEATAIFSVRLPVPTITINAPAAGQIYNHGKPIISGMFSGAEEAGQSVTLSITGPDKGVVVDKAKLDATDNNEFAYMHTEELKHGDYTINVEFTDANGRTAKTSTVFTVDVPGPTVMIPFTCFRANV